MATPSPTRADADKQESFAARYRSSGSDPLIEAELEVLGSDYQANGYTTRAQADELGRRLGLEPGQRLLDIGSGCGWPGLYLAASHRCAVLVVDPIVDGVRAAAARAERDGIGGAGALRARGTDLPVRPQSFDAVVHTDVIC